MDSVNPAIFRTYDIRGVYGTDFDAAFASRLARHLAAHLGADTMVVGRDGRVSGPELAHAVIDGFLGAGVRVVDIGEVSSPQFYWAVRSLDAAGGIMVTASHNPGADNGFKAVVRRGALLDILGGHELRQIYDSHGGAHRTGGRTEVRDIVPGYAAAVAYAAGWEGGTEIAASVQGPRSVMRVLERLGPVAPDDSFAARFDADGDRVMFFDGGIAIAPDALFLLLADRLQASPLVADIRFSRVVAEWCAAHDVPLTRSRVGRLFLTEAMHRTGAALGGELSGHFYWHAFGGMECPELTFLRVARLGHDDRTPLAALATPYLRYARSDEVSVPLTDRKHASRLLALVERRFKGCPMDRTDGLTVDCWDGHLAVSADEGFWFNVRPSNTEPVLRLVVESKRKDLLERRVQEVLGLLS